jgi:hypothetical protein
LVPERARACPECGADEETGWSERAYAQRLGLPDDEFDYGAFLQEEFGSEKKQLRPHGVSRFWWIVGIVLLAVLLTLFVSSVWK